MVLLQISWEKGAEALRYRNLNLPATIYTWGIPVQGVSVCV